MQGHFSSPNKLPTLQCPFGSRVFLAVNLHYHEHNLRGQRVLLGFKIRSHSRTSANSAQISPSVGRKKGHGGLLPSILRSLDSSDDVEKTLVSFCENLSPKEQTVILKEQRSWERVVRVFDWFKTQKDYIPNVIHYNVVLRTLGKAEKWDELRLCWVEMAKNRVSPTNNTYGMLVDVYGKAGLVKESLLWIKHMRVRGLFPDEVTMNTVVRVLKDAGEFDWGDMFYKNWCRGRVELDDFDLNSMVDSSNGSTSEPITFKHFLLTELFRTGTRSSNPKVRTGSDTENLTRKPRLTSTYNTLIDLYGKAGRLKDAAEVFAEMLKSGVPMDTITFNTMIFTCGSHGQLSEAESLLTKMEERRISPDTKTYNIFLSLYAAAGNIDASLECYRKIRDVGLFPDIVTHRALLHILCERNMVEDVEKVIEEMEKSSLLIDEHSLPSLVKMYVNKGLISRAKTMLEKYRPGNGFSTKINAAILDVYAESEYWAEAEALFLEKKDFIGRNMDATEYNVMIKAYGKAKFYDKAFFLFKGMRNHGIWPDDCTYNSLIQMFAGGDQSNQARELLAEMQGMGFKPNCLTFSALIACYAHHGQLVDAVDLFKEMIRSGVKPNEIVYGALINGFAELGQVEEALNYFRLFKESGMAENVIVLTSLIKAYSKMGCLEEAKAVYERMKNLETGVDSVASNSMINLYADLGMVSEAKLVFEDLREKGLADGSSFVMMMYLYKNTGMLESATEVAAEMKESGLLKDCSAFNQVMACYAASGQLQECGELLHEMVSIRLLPDLGTFKVLFTVLKKGGLPIETVTQLESSYLEGKPYSRQAVIALVFSIVGMHSLAHESCETFLKAEVTLDSFAYNAAIYAYGTAGDIDKALNIFVKMLDKDLQPDIVTYINLIGCYGKGGMVGGVKRIYSQLKYGEIEPNESLFNAIISAYKSVKRHDLARLVGQEMKFALGAEKKFEPEGRDRSDEVCNEIPEVEVGESAPVLDS